MEVHWTGYVGIATGLAGFVLAVFAHLRVNRMKRIDTRHELDMELHAIRSESGELLDLIHRAQKSRHAVMAAQGRYQSGAREAFDRTYAENRARAERLLKRVTKFDPASFDGRGHEILIRGLTEIRKLQREIRQTSQKCQADLATDDRDRDHIRQDHRAVVAAKIARPDPHH
jgi:hypothetical protein